MGRRLVRAVWRWQRAEARRLGGPRGLRGGAVAFSQLFGSALQLTPHLHVLIPEGLWTGNSFVPLPPPRAEDVAGVLERLVRQLARDLQALEVPWPEEAVEALQLQAVQHRLPLPEPAACSARRQPRLAVREGFRLHADTAVHAHDRQGLERLCRYGSRGPLAEQRLSLLEDGRYGYRTKRGPTLILTGAELVKRLVALVPAGSRHLTSFHGVFAPRARLRPSLIPPAEEPAPSAPVLSTSPPWRATAAVSPRRPRLDWATLQRRTFGVDVWRCLCGGTRTVLAVVTSPRAAEEVLRNLGLLGPRALRPSGPGPPQLSLAV